LEQVSISARSCERFEHLNSNDAPNALSCIRRMRRAPPSPSRLGRREREGRGEVGTARNKIRPSAWGQISTFDIWLHCGLKQDTTAIDIQD